MSLLLFVLLLLLHHVVAPVSTGSIAEDQRSIAEGSIEEAWSSVAELEDRGPDSPDDAYESWDSDAYNVPPSEWMNWSIWDSSWWNNWWEGSGVDGGSESDGSWWEQYWSSDPYGWRTSDEHSTDEDSYSESEYGGKMSSFCHYFICQLIGKKGICKFYR